jgi:hypothetical protein
MTFILIMGNINSIILNYVHNSSMLNWKSELFTHEDKEQTSVIMSDGWPTSFASLHHLCAFF